MYLDFKIQGSRRVRSSSNPSRSTPRNCSKGVRLYDSGLFLRLENLGFRNPNYRIQNSFFGDSGLFLRPETKKKVGECDTASGLVIRVQDLTFVFGYDDSGVKEGEAQLRFEPLNSSELFERGWASGFRRI